MRKSAKTGEFYPAWKLKLGSDEMLIIYTRNKSGQDIEIPIRGDED